jgi:large subunit ribosomal protein L21
MYAVIQTGGKQYRVAPGDVIDVETIAGEPGADVEFTDVVALQKDGGEFLTGSALGGAKVTGTIAGAVRGDKILVFKYKRKKQYRRTTGHRQNYTRVKVNEILA